MEPMTAIAIFVKTPGLSPIKTRLASGIGAVAAEMWHRLAAQATAEVAVASNIGPVYWAIAEDEGTQDPSWAELPHLIQPTGGLGLRMAVVHRTLVERHGAGMLLGADTPQIDHRSLRQAHSWLTAPQRRQVIGLAHDGGFWLFGANHLIPTSQWEEVPYSQRTTSELFMRAMQHEGDCLQLEVNTDVDEATDLDPALMTLQQLSSPTATQVQLIQWIRQHRALPD